MDHSLLHGPTLFDLTLTTAQIIDFPLEETRAGFISIHQHFNVYSLVCKEPPPHAALRHFILSLIILTIYGQVDLAENLCFESKNVFCKKQMLSQRLLSIKSEVMGTLKGLKYEPHDPEGIDLKIDNLLKQILSIAR